MAFFRHPFLRLQNVTLRFILSLMNAICSIFFLPILYILIYYYISIYSFILCSIINLFQLYYILIGQ